MNWFGPFGYDTKITIICNPKICGPETQIKGHIIFFPKKQKTTAFSDFLLSRITSVSPTDLFVGDVCCSGEIFLNACDFFTKRITEDRSTDYAWRSWHTKCFPNLLIYWFVLIICGFCRTIWCWSCWGRGIYSLLGKGWKNRVLIVKILLVVNF